MAFKTIYLFIVDHENKRFSVEGPMNDAFLLQERVHIEQKKGRNVECFSINASSSAEVEASAKYFVKKTKYGLSKNRVI